MSDLYSQPSRTDGTTITDIPEGTPREQIQAAFDMARRLGFAGKVFSFSRVALGDEQNQQLEQSRQNFNAPLAPSATDLMAGDPIPEPPQGFAAQALGSTARGLATAVPAIADTAMALPGMLIQGAANMPVPAPVGAFANIVSRASGRDEPYTGEGVFRTRTEPTQMLPENMAPTQERAQQLMDRLGFARSESEAAQIWETIVREVGAAAALGLVSKAVAAGKSVPAAIQRMATGFADAPLSTQIRAAFAGELGNEGTRWAVRELGERAELAPEQIQALENVLGTVVGMGTELGVEVGIPRMQRQQTINRLDAANLTPESAREIIAQGERFDVPVRRSDVIPPDTSSAIQAQRVRESLGYGQRAIAEQTRASNAAIQNFLSDYNVSIGQPRRRVDTEELAQTFIGPRQEQFARFGELKNNALSAVPSDAVIDTSGAISRVDAQIERLRRLGGNNADPNLPTNPDLLTGPGRAVPNRYQSTITKLEQMRAQLQNKTIDELEMIRNDFGEDFIPESGFGQMKTRDREVVQDVYDAIRTDIGNAVQHYGGDDAFEDWQMANTALSDLMEDYRTNTVRRLVEDVNAIGPATENLEDLPLEVFEQKQRATRMAIEANPELLENLFVSGSPSDIRAILPYLGGEGRVKGIAAYMQDILEKSRVPGEASTIIDRGSFSDELRKSLQRREVTMQPHEMQMADGLQVLFDHVRGPRGVNRVELSSMLNAVPGARYGAARFFGTAQGAAMAAGSMLSAGQLARIYESPQTRDYLLELASTPPKTPRADILVRQIIDAVSQDEEQQASEGQAAPGANRQVR